MSRFVIACSGTLGDVHPCLALGRGLAARGHEAAIATAPSYRGLVEREGLEFHPVRPDIAPVVFGAEDARRVHDAKGGTEYLLRTLVLPHIEAMHADLMAACARADLLVVHPIMFAAPLVAEERRLRWISIKQAPGSFVSAHDPPVLPPLPWLHHLRWFGPAPNRLAFNFFSRITRTWMAPVDALRARRGLPPADKHPILAGMLSDLGTIAAFPTPLGSPQPDWPPNTRVTGYIFHDESRHAEPLDPALEAFLSEGAPPVVFTLGSSAVRDAAAFNDASLAAVEQVGCRAVLLTGGGPAACGRVSASVFVAGYVPHARILPRAAAVVHHGGMGTLAHAMHAGVPMLIVPFVNDQADNAFRAVRLGIGRTLARQAYQAPRVARELRALLERPRYRTRAAAIAGRLRGEDGLSAACEMAIASV
jgi:UDP:flavonoid glycosyltransferase YjiC (YdhE family)